MTVIAPALSWPDTSLSAPRSPPEGTVKSVNTSQFAEIFQQRVTQSAGGSCRMTGSGAQCDLRVESGNQRDNALSSDQGFSAKNTLPVADNESRRADLEVTAKATITGESPAIRFINGSIFGYSTVLGGSKAISPSFAPGPQTSGPLANGAVAANGNTDPSTTSRDLSDTRTALGQVVQIPSAMSIWAPIIAVDPEQCEAVPGLVDSGDSNAQSMMTSGQPIELAASLAAPGRADERTSIGAAFGPVQAVRLSGDVAGNARELSSIARLSPVSDIREEQVGLFSSVHVAAALASEAVGIRIVARISGATARDEEQIEQSLLTVACDAKGGVNQLRLNGMDRIALVRK